jgi:hypothetical protein
MCAVNAKSVTKQKVHSVEQISIGLKFSKSRTGSDLRYSSSRYWTKLYVCNFESIYS